MPKRFQPEQFTPTQWATAEQKVAWANAMATWALRGFPQEGFTRRLYGPLHTNLFGHIAHYDLHGFFATWFSDIHQQLEWLKYAARGGAYGAVGDPHFTWSDVEKAFTAWVQQSGLVERYQHLCAQDTEQRERAQLAYLLSKYPDATNEPAAQPDSERLNRLFVTELPSADASRFRTLDAVPTVAPRKRSTV